MLQLPNYENAIINIEKIRDYCLNSEHPVGKHKAKIFKKALGIIATDAEWLINEILGGLNHSVAHEKNSDKYGKRYTVHIIIRKLDKEAEVVTGWIIKHRTINPILTTCFVNI